MKPGVVAQIGKRPPVVPPDPALAACFATPFEDTTAQDLELMVETPAVAAKAKASPGTPQPPHTSLAYLDLIVPDLEDHMSMSPAPQVFPPVPTTPLSSESEERQGDLINLDRDPEDDEPVTVTPWPCDDEEDDDAEPPAPAPQPAAMETQTEPGTSATAAAGSGDSGATGSGSQQAASSAAAAQTALAGEPQDDSAPLPPPKFPPPDVVAREQRRAERRHRPRCSWSRPSTGCPAPSQRLARGCRVAKVRAPGHQPAMTCRRSVPPLLSRAIAAAKPANAQHAHRIFATTSTLAQHGLLWTQDGLHGARFALLGNKSQSR